MPSIIDAGSVGPIPTAGTDGGRGWGCIIKENHDIGRSMSRDLEQVKKNLVKHLNAEFM